MRGLGGDGVGGAGRSGEGGGGAYFVWGELLKKKKIKMV